ncbi:MAG: hypothetical protein ACXW5U_06190 [Thermoanaerobaculia bacterium]
MNYELGDGVRIFRTGDEIRLRKGVWNHQEATLRLTGQPQPVVAILNAVYDALLGGKPVDLAAVAAAQGVNGDSLKQFEGLFETLLQQQYLRSSSQKDAARTVGSLLGGTLGFEEQIASPRPVMLFSDGDYTERSAKMLAQEMGLPLDVADADLAHTLTTTDLTQRGDALDHVDAVARLEKVFQPYSCVVACLAAPNLTLLRNLNRLLIRAEKPLIAGLIDGPFVIALSTIATDTGCFECFEQRSLARLEDTAVYHEFVRATAGTSAAGAKWAAPQLHMLVSTVLSEAFLFASFGMMRLAGRVVSVYLPLLEIQVQDLLRIPYCPACGFVSRGQMNEMYTSTRRIVTEMMNKIRIEG